jgi:hypothetical protein
MAEAENNDSGAALALRHQGFQDNSGAPPDARRRTAVLSGLFMPRLFWLGIDTLRHIR